MVALIWIVFWWADSSLIIFGTWILTMRAHTKKPMNEGVVPEMLGFIIYETSPTNKKTPLSPKVLSAEG